MNVTLVTAPIKEPIKLEEVKIMIGLETDQDQFDAFISSLITSSINFFENETNTVIMEQTWKGYLDDWPFPEDYIEVWKPPLKSITAIKYTDSGGSQNTWASNQYDVDVNIKPGRVYLGYLKNWPTAVLAPITNAIEVEFKCGYTKEGDVPYSIKNVLKLWVEYYFTNRGADAGELPKSIMNQILKHKIYYL